VLAQEISNTCAAGRDAPQQQSLLQALLCAGMHSRAAYGYAMAAGHLSSLLNFALLQTVGFCAMLLLSALHTIMQDYLTCSI
jgi:hypothetical protein